MTEKRQQSIAGYMREHLATIEGKLSIGVKQETIVEELEKAGFKTTLKNFRNELCRARKKNPSPATPPPLPSGGKTTVQKPQNLNKSQDTSVVPTAKKPSNPLKESRGFDYQSSLSVSDSELF